VGGNYFFHDPKKQKSFYKTLLLQKATHSLDLLNWFMGSDPRKVYAVGGRDFYGGEEDPEKRCKECEKASTCPYRINPERFVMDYGATVQIPDYCVWGRQMDLNDNSELCITYANGAKATFHECHFTPEYSREFWFVGTKGKLYGYYDNPGRFLVRVQHAYDDEWRSEEWRPMATDGGHGGGDVRLRDEFYERCSKGEKAPDMISSAYYSTVLAICAEESIDSGIPVMIPQIGG
jgi:predicted dehydrogenase